jgi:hypothetical protein
MTETQTNVRRVYQTYLYATCFVTVIISLLSAGFALTSLIRIIAPRLYGGGPGSESFVRKAAGGSLISALLFGGIAFFVFWYHWMLAKGVRDELERADRELPSMAAPLAPPVDEEEPPAPRPRPRAPRKPPASS